MKSICLLLVITHISFSVQAQNFSGRLTNLGPQIKASVIQGSIFLQDKAGRELVYTVVIGNPAYLPGYTVDRQEMVLLGNIEPAI